MYFGTIQQPIFFSQVLAGNRLGDPTTRPVTVYLPPNYDEEQAYPSIYWLASHGKTGQAFLNWIPWGENPIQKIDRLMHIGEMPPAIIVMPDCWTKLGGSQYLDSAMGKYESYLIEAVIPFVDANFSTGDQRGVVGFSSGGYGALMLGMRQPEIFHAVADHAGDIYWEYACLPMIAGLHTGLAAYGGVTELFNQLDTVPKDGKWWKIVMALCWSMAHGENPNHPLGFDLPIDEATGALRQDVWERWLPFDPLRAVEKPEHQAALKQLKLLFFDAGSYDEYHLQVGARLLSKKLTALGIDHQFEEFTGRHTSSDVRFDYSIGLLIEALTE